MIEGLVTKIYCIRAQTQAKDMKGAEHQNQNIIKTDRLQQHAETAVIYKYQSEHHEEVGKFFYKKTKRQLQ